MRDAPALIPPAAPAPDERSGTLEQSVRAALLVEDDARVRLWLMNLLRGDSRPDEAAAEK